MKDSVTGEMTLGTQDYSNGVVIVSARFTSL